MLNSDKISNTNLTNTLSYCLFLMFILLFIFNIYLSFNELKCAIKMLMKIARQLKYKRSQKGMYQSYVVKPYIIVN